jgi:hypothetical protein
VPQASSIAGTGRLLLDVTINGLDPDVTLTSPVTGTLTEGVNGSIQVTPNSVNNTQVLATQRWDGLITVIRKGVLAAGAVAPDLQLSFYVDGSYDYTSTLLLDGSEDSNMCPAAEYTEDGIVWVLGESLLQAARAARLGRRGSGYARRFTGIPAQDQIQLLVTSHAGFAASAFVVPPSVQVYGDVLDQAALDYINQYLGVWDPASAAAITYNSLRRELLGYGGYSGNFQLPGGTLTMQNFTAKPNGWAQTSPVKVYRYARFARPKADVSPKTIFALSNDTNVGGAANNVDSKQQLGWRYAGTANAIILEKAGRRPSPASPSPSLSYGATWFGLTFDQAKTVYPTDTPYGTVVSALRNPIPFGTKAPTIDEPTYYRYRRWGSWATGEGGDELIFNENAAVTIAGTGTISGTGTADADSVGRNLVDETSVIGVQLVAGGPVTS